MNIAEIKNSLNTLHFLLNAINGPEDTMTKTSAESHYSKFDDEKIAQIHKLVLEHSKAAFSDQVKKLKPILNGKMSAIGRELDVHINTYRNYLNGNPSDPYLMAQIYDKMIAAARSRKKELLTEI